MPSVDPYIKCGDKEETPNEWGYGRIRRPIGTYVRVYWGEGYTATTDVLFYYDSDCRREAHVLSRNTTPSYKDNRDCFYHTSRRTWPNEAEQDMEWLSVKSFTEPKIFRNFISFNLDRFIHEG